MVVSSGCRAKYHISLKLNLGEYKNKYEVPISIQSTFIQVYVKLKRDIVVEELGRKLRADEQTLSVLERWH